jgi:hypothetical protein
LVYYIYYNFLKVTLFLWKLCMVFWNIKTKSLFNKSHVIFKSITQIYNNLISYDFGFSTQCEQEPLPNSGCGEKAVCKNMCRKNKMKHHMSSPGWREQGFLYNNPCGGFYKRDPPSLSGFLYKTCTGTPAALICKLIQMNL